LYAIPFFPYTTLFRSSGGGLSRIGRGRALGPPGPRRNLVQLDRKLPVEHGEQRRRQLRLRVFVGRAVQQRAADPDQCLLSLVSSAPWASRSSSPELVRTSSSGSGRSSPSGTASSPASGRT